VQYIITCVKCVAVWIIDTGLLKQGLSHRVILDGSPFVFTMI